MSLTFESDVITVHACLLAELVVFVPLQFKSLFLWPCILAIHRHQKPQLRPLQLPLQIPQMASLYILIHHRPSQQVGFCFALCFVFRLSLLIDPSIKDLGFEVLAFLEFPIDLHYSNNSGVNSNEYKPRSVGYLRTIHTPTTVQI